MPYDVPSDRIGDLVDVIGQAFSSARDPLADYVFEKEPAALSFKERLFCSIGEACPPAALRQASSENMEAISVWFPPGVTYPEEEAQVFDPSEFEFQETLKRIESMLEIIGTSIRKLGTEPQWYLHILATRPEYMGQGYTSSLIQPIFKRATAGGIPCTLVCPKHNVSLYEHLGFRIVDETKFSTSSYFLYSMRRDAHS